jgi:hypothetical protein
MDHGCGSIGQLLGSIGQRYSHNSLLVNRGTEIRHSTSVEDRVGDDVVGIAARGRLDEDVLKYQWPGTEGSTTHSIGEMFGEYYVGDPVTAGKRWRQGGEHTANPGEPSCVNDVAAIPGVVLRPTPDAPADILLKVRELVPQRAKQLDSHYRFALYSPTTKSSVIQDNGLQRPTRQLAPTSFGNRRMSRG